jgi:uncharacterized membrane protein HdeD (DUF308 family)
VAGVLELAFAWRTRKARGAFWYFVIGAAYLAVGIWVLANPAMGMVALSLALGIMLLVRAGGELMLTWELRSTHVWGWYGVDGLVSTALGALVLAAWPVGSILYLGLYFGVALVFGGAQRLAVAFAVRRALPPSQKAPPLSAAHA